MHVHVAALLLMACKCNASCWVPASSLLLVGLVYYLHWTTAHRACILLPTAQHSKELCICIAGFGWKESSIGRKSVRGASENVNACCTPVQEYSSSAARKANCVCFGG